MLEFTKQEISFDVVKKSHNFYFIIIPPSLHQLKSQKCTCHALSFQNLTNLASNFLSYITNPSSTPFFHLHKLNNNNLTIFEPCITRNIRILSIFLLIFVATMVQPIQLHYLIVEKNDTNLTSTSTLFGFIDFFLYSTFFIRIHKFFSSFRFFLLCHFHSGDSEKQATETDFSQESESSVICRESGEIERDEVKMVMEKLGIFCSSESEELEEKYGSKELSELFEEQEPSLKEVKMAFDVFDENKDGFIDAKELQRVLCILGLKEVSEVENCQKMIRNFDENHDGRIDFIEFVKIMESRFC